MKRLSRIVCIMLLLVMTGCGEKPPEMITDSNFQLDTLVTVSVYEYQDEAILEDVFDEIDRLERILSAHYLGSDPHNLAQNSGKAYVDVSPDTLFLLQESEKYSRLTEGCFDITVGPLVSLWDIHGGYGHLPSQDELDKTLPLINYQDILIQGEQVMLKHEGMKVDLGAIAKGYIADQVKEFLLQRGVTSGVVDLGGNVVLIGKKPSGDPFKIGIQDPEGATGEYLGIMTISDESLVSSGSYERFFVHEGKSYHHILNPKTGFPVENELLQVTIISKESVTGEGFSTSAFLLGLKAGLRLIDETPDVSAIFVTKDKKIYLSRDFDGDFTLTNSDYTLEEDAL